MPIDFSALSPLRLIWNLDTINQASSPLVASFREMLVGVRAVSQEELHSLDASHFDDKGMACLLLKDALLNVSGKIHKLDAKDFVTARQEDPLRSRLLKASVINLAHKGNVLLEDMNPSGQPIVIDQTLTQSLKDVKIELQKLRVTIEKLEANLPNAYSEIFAACMLFILSEVADAVTSLSAGLAGQVSGNDGRNNATIAPGEDRTSGNWETQAHFAAFALKSSGALTALWAAIHDANHSRDESHPLRVALNKLENVVEQLDAWREDPAGLVGLKDDIKDAFFHEVQPSRLEQVATLSRNLVDWITSFLHREDAVLPVSRTMQQQSQQSQQSQPTSLAAPMPQRLQPIRPAPPVPQGLPGPQGLPVQQGLQVRQVPQVPQVRQVPRAAQPTPPIPSP